MKTLLLRGLVVSFLAVGLVTAQSNPLQGTWELNPARSTAANPMPKAETLVYDIAGQVEHGVAELTTADGSTRKSEYSATQNDGHWHSVMRNGAQSSSIMVVKLDEWTSAQFSKRADGTPRMALRVVSKDGRTFTWTSISRDGRVTGSYLFERQ